MENCKQLLLYGIIHLVRTQAFEKLKFPIPL